MHCFLSFAAPQETMRAIPKRSRQDESLPYETDTPPICHWSKECIEIPIIYVSIKCYVKMKKFELSV